MELDRRRGVTWGINADTTLALGQSARFRNLVRRHAAALGVTGHEGGETGSVALTIAANAMLRRGLPADDMLEEYVASRVDAPANHRPLALPPGMAPLLQHEGIDPEAALALSLLNMGKGIGILRDTASGSAMQVANVRLGFRDMTWVALGDGRRSARWSWREAEMLVDAVPHAARTALEGRPLRALLSHPVLDRMDIGIVAILDSLNDPAMMEVVTTLHPEP